eukprot:7644972-Karenia_brevis.AAC.1
MGNRGQNLANIAAKSHQKTSPRKIRNGLVSHGPCHKKGWGSPTIKESTAPYPLQGHCNTPLVPQGYNGG